MQTRRWNFKDDDKTRDINRWLTGIIAPGLYYGYDFNPTANMNLNLVHTSTGFKDVDHLAAESGFQGVVVTRQGVVVKEDAALSIGAVNPGHASLPRIDIVVLTHSINEVAGGAQALYSIIQGTPAASPVAPALTNTNTQTKIGELYIPANTVALNGVGVVWTRNALVLGNYTGAVTTILMSNLTANRALVSTGAGKVGASSITDTELGTLAGIGSTAIATQLAGKQATITGAITTVLSSDLTADRVVVSNGSGKVVASSVTSTQLGALGAYSSTNNRAIVTNGSGQFIASSITDTEINQLAGIGGTTIATQLAGKQATITGAITTVLSSDLTANRAVVSNASGKIISSSITDTEINQLAGIGGTTIATQLAGKQATITGAITTVLSSDLTANRVVVSNSSGKVISSGILDSELNQLAGVNGPVVSSHVTAPRLCCAVLPIVDWNMDTQVSKAIDLPSGVTRQMVRPPLQAFIRGDVGGIYENFTFVSDGYRATIVTTTGLYADVSNSADQVIVSREASSSTFDSTDFDATGGFIRGWVTVFYQP